MRLSSLGIVLGALVAAGLGSAWFSAPARAQQTYEPDPYSLQVNPQLAYCAQLEQTLAILWQQQNQSGNRLPRILAEIRKTERIHQQSQAQAEQQDCFDYFFFSKTWRKTPVCLKLAAQIEKAERRLEQLERERAVAADTRQDTSQRDQVIEELARNNCGPQYVQEAQRRRKQNSAFWWDNNAGEEAYDPSLATPGYGQTLPYATYRTVCVRLCDGYYFPISFATVPASFAKDASACTNQCAAPAKLFYYQNPGAEVDSAISLDGVPYTQLPTAWQYRTKLVNGCSCKPNEYDQAKLGEQGVPAWQGGGETLPWQQKSQAQSQDPIGSLIQN
jgi:hypothetical protein